MRIKIHGVGIIAVALASVCAWSAEPPPPNPDDIINNQDRVITHVVSGQAPMVGSFKYIFFNTRFSHILTKADPGKTKLTEGKGHIVPNSSYSEMAWVEVRDDEVMNWYQSGAVPGARVNAIVKGEYTVIAQGGGPPGPPAPPQPPQPAKPLEWTTMSIDLDLDADTNRDGLDNFADRQKDMMVEDKDEDNPKDNPIGALVTGSKPGDLLLRGLMPKGVPKGTVNIVQGVAKDKDDKELQLGVVKITRENGTGVKSSDDLWNDVCWDDYDDKPKPDLSLKMQALVPGVVLVAAKYKKGDLAFEDRVRVTVHPLQIVAAGDYIVPKSANNCVRYTWGALNPDSIKMEVLDKDGTVVRSIAGLPVTFITGKTYAEQKWNGCKDAAGTQQLTEAQSPYTIRLTGAWGQKSDVAEAKPLLEEWWMDIEIADAPAGKETLVTGPDERSVTADNLNVKVSLDGNPEESPKFTVTPDTVTADGPKDNQRACLVTPQFIFYTTPKAPYDIRYKVTIEEKTKTSGTSKNGLKLDTVVDGALNPWDMDPSKPGRQAKGTWQFGVDSTGKPPQATRRDATEVYE